MKVCKRCGIEKPLSEYYVHRSMGDGHLNFCKECTKKRVREFGRSEHGREHDKERNKTAKRKQWLIEYQRKRRRTNQLVTRCRNKFQKAVLSGKIKKGPCNICGGRVVQGHHEDYNEPLKVVWLCGIHHRELHDQYRRKN